MTRLYALLAIAFVSLNSLSAMDLRLPGDDVDRLTLRSTIKLGAFAAKNPHAPLLYPDTTNSVALARLRLDLTLDLNAATSAQVAYEHSSRRLDHDAAVGAGAGILPTTAGAPYRLVPLADELASDDRGVWQHELDRALIAWHPDWGEVIVGRQAIGLGRGVLFSAVDFFAPFSTLEVDREWRRGVDAARVEYRLGDTGSVEAIAVGGESWDASAFVLRARGYFGSADAEVLVGRRGEDPFVGLVLSASVAAAEVHGELAVFHTPEAHIHGQPGGADHIVPVAVIGSSYTVDVGNGLTLLGEYHYSGFGARDPADIDALLADAASQKRLLRGDMRILGRHALGAQASYPVNESLSSSLTVIANPQDRSAVFAPALGWDINRSTSLRLSVTLPVGESPRGLDIRDEYGSSAKTIFVQLAMYY